MIMWPLWAVVALNNHRVFMPVASPAVTPELGVWVQQIPVTTREVCIYEVQCTEKAALPVNNKKFQFFAAAFFVTTSSQNTNKQMKIALCHETSIDQNTAANYNYMTENMRLLKWSVMRALQCPVHGYIVWNRHVKLNTDVKLGRGEDGTARPGMTVGVLRSSSWGVTLS